MKAQGRLERARAIDSGSVVSFSHAAKRSVTLSIRAKSIWGVFVPEIEEAQLARSLEARDISPVGERAGRLKGGKGSVTLMPILTMPDDDITHPIPDLTGYITEGQIVLSRALHRKGIYPPIDVLPCLSRLMNLGIGKGKTREGHRLIADQLYSAYAKGMDVRRLVTIVGEEGLSELDRKYLSFADVFERQFVGQGETDRSIEETLDLGLELLKSVPEREAVATRRR